jgi:hypothetical protein
MADLAEDRVISGVHPYRRTDRNRLCCPQTGAVSGDVDQLSWYVSISFVPSGIQHDCADALSCCKAGFASPFHM